MLCIIRDQVKNCHLNLSPLRTTSRDRRCRLLTRRRSMTEIRWEQYPLVAEHELARHWLQRQAYLQLAPTTIDAYGRGLIDYLSFCLKQNIQPAEVITRDLVCRLLLEKKKSPNPK